MIRVASEKSPSKAPGEGPSVTGSVSLPQHCATPRATTGTGHWGVQGAGASEEALAAPKAVVASPPPQISLLPSELRNQQ